MAYPCARRRGQNGRRVEGTSSSVLVVEESLLPRARELHQQLEAHLRGLGLPPVSLQAAERFHENGSDGDGDAAGAAGSPFDGGDSGAEEAAGAAASGQRGEAVAAGGDGSGSSSGAQALLERMQEHINGSNVSGVTAELAGQRGVRPDARYVDNDTSNADGRATDDLAAEVGSA